MLEVLLLLLLHLHASVAAAAAGHGYVASFQGPGEIFAAKATLDNVFTSSAGFTVAAWMRYTDVSSNGLFYEVHLITESDNNLFNGFGGPGRSFAFSGASSISTSAPSGHDFTGWHHYMLVYDPGAGKARWFIDGTKVNEEDKASYAHASTWATQTPQVFLGAMVRPGSEPRIVEENRVFFGEMDDVAFWNVALTDSDISARWDSSSGLASLTKRLVDGTEPDLQLFFNFNDPTSFEAVRAARPSLG